MSRDEGFGLLEAIVSLAVLGIIAVTLLDLVIGSAARRGLAERRANTMLTAQSLLNSVGADVPLAVGHQVVDALDHRKWSIDISISPESKRLLELAVTPAGEAQPVLRALRIHEATQ